MNCPHCHKYFKSPTAASGGKKSRRTLTSEEAKAMSAKGVAAKAEKRKGKVV